MKRWRLTPRAQASLIDIALWTLDTFGPVQADRYEAEVLDRCTAIAEGRAATQDCALLAGEAKGSGLRFARAGEHFVLFLDMGEEIVIVDVLHARTDLPSRIAALRMLPGD
ncbi:MAG: type II toxin-antitoxin system RelE/ParE family toxin [Rhodobacteraceae bacterium]|nr:type II toxin-antitoxin system RelE/ParE family toxin [Paracoccaceae bacterium]